jgi:hypothetical protein
MSLQNNTYYLLSEQYKLDKKKKKQQEIQARIPKPPTCKICDMDPPYFIRGERKGWCKSCAEFDMWIADWADACWNEDCKPKDKQNELVYLGYSKAIRDSLNEK